MPNVENTEDLFLYELERAHEIETTLLEALSSLEEDVGVDALDEGRDPELRPRLQEALQQHRAETETHVDRLEMALDAVDRTPSERSTPALDGLVRQKEQFNNVVLNDAVRPVYYLGTARQIEELEIALYRRLLDLGQQLDLPGAATEPVEETLREEEAMLETLEELRESSGYDQLVTTLAPEAAPD